MWQTLSACCVQSYNDEVLVAFEYGMGECNMHKHTCFVTMPCGDAFQKASACVAPWPILLCILGNDIVLLQLHGSL